MQEVAVLHERAAGDQDVADGGAGGCEGDPVVGISTCDHRARPLEVPSDSNRFEPDNSQQPAKGE